MNLSNMAGQCAVANWSHCQHKRRNHIVALVWTGLFGFVLTACDIPRPYAWDPWKTIDVSTNGSSRSSEITVVISEETIAADTLAIVPTNATSVLLVQCRLDTKNQPLDALWRRCGNNLEHLSLEGSEVETEALQTLTNFGRLAHLDLSSTKFRGERLSQIGRIPELRKVNWNYSNTRSCDAIKWLRENSIEECSLEGLRVDRVDISVSDEWLGRISTLTGFRVTSSSRPLDWLANMSNMVQLSVSESRPEDILHIRKCRRLQTLSLMGSVYQEDEVEVIVKELGRLSSVSIWNSVINTNTIVALSHNMRLKEVRFPQCIFRKGALDMLWNLTKVEVVDVSGTEIEDGDLDRIDRLTSLSVLNMTNCKRITDIAMAKLENVISLKRVCLQGTRVSRTACNHLRETLAGRCYRPNVYHEDRKGGDSGKIELQDR